MKSLNTLLFLSLMSLCGCSDLSEPDSHDNGTQSNVTDIPTDISLPRNAGVRYKLTFTASESWKIYPYEAKSTYTDLFGEGKIHILNSDYNMAESVDITDWCSVSPSSGEAGAAEVMVTLDANEGDTGRKAVLVVESAGDKVMFTVEQTTLDKSQMPEYDDSYETPQEPENPEEPEDPTDPENPENPENPGDPENPENPENPGDPENPENPEHPDEPGIDVPPVKPHISFSDSEFARLALLYYDADGDGGISEEEIADVTVLDEAFSGIKAGSMDDLRLFLSLRSLTLTASSSVRNICLGYGNKIERVDLSGSSVEEVDLSGCGGIKEIVCTGASSLRLMTLPRQMPSLSVLELAGTAVEELAVSDAPALVAMEYTGTLGSLRSLSLDNVGIETLTLSGTPVEKVVLSRMTRLENADISGNGTLTEVAVTEAGVLTSLSIAGCAVQQIDLSGAPSLESFTCDGNPLQSLDISANRAMRTISLSGVPDANGKGKLNIYMAFDAKDPEIIPDDGRITIKIKAE